MEFMQSTSLDLQSNREPRRKRREVQKTSWTPTTATATSWDPSTASMGSNRLEADEEALLGNQWSDVVTIDVKEEQLQELQVLNGQGYAPIVVRSTLANAKRPAER